ncbi:MAG TPA: DUF3052 domain-containing protein [Cyclobacteriaceae bacterium]|nr:DUF3052 domain-containing protein [Cyclobacteriaceae bacterium]
MKTAGYSGTSLAKKLGIKENFAIKIVNAPDYYFDLFTDLPKNLITSAKNNLNFIHYFETNQKNFRKEILKLKKQLAQDGMIWVSWYKKSAMMPTDITEDVIRNFALKNGLVDIKVCAVDEQWSGLKLVIPVKDRKKK